MDLRPEILRSEILRSELLRSEIGYEIIIYKFKLALLKTRLKSKTRVTIWPIKPVGYYY
jgi:hypothetical protein